MAILIAGLILFIAPHSVRIVADDWRTRRIAQMGANPWKAAYSVLSIAGFVLIVWGYGLSRHASPDLWTPASWTYRATGLFSLVGLVLLVAAYVPGTRMKAAIGHPMLLGTAIWAFGHLLSNGRLADLVLFGAFLVWSAIAFVSARARDRKAGVTYAARGLGRDAIAVVVGVIVWAALLYFHQPLFGVRPPL